MQNSTDVPVIWVCFLGDGSSSKAYSHVSVGIDNSKRLK